MIDTPKKYELVADDTVTSPDGRTLFRIRALVAIADLVAAGDVGGYVESERNLAQTGDAGVSGEAQVHLGNAWVSGEAQVHLGNAWVSGEAWLFGEA